MCCPVSSNPWAPCCEAPDPTGAPDHGWKMHSLGLWSLWWGFSFVVQLPVSNLRSKSYCSWNPWMPSRRAWTTHGWIIHETHEECSNIVRESACTLGNDLFMEFMNKLFIDFMNDLFMNLMNGLFRDSMTFLNGLLVKSTIVHGVLFMEYCSWISWIRFQKWIIHGFHE